jgi:hypothetical protein
MRLRRRRNTAHDLKQAEDSLETARAAREEQELKRRHEEKLVDRLDRLAAGNHLAERFLQAFTERHQ